MNTIVVILKKVLPGSSKLYNGSEYWLRFWSPKKQHPSSKKVIYTYRMAWERVNHGVIFIFGWSIPLRRENSLNLIVCRTFCFQNHFIFGWSIPLRRENNHNLIVYWPFCIQNHFTFVIWSFFFVVVIIHTFTDVIIHTFNNFHHGYRQLFFIEYTIVHGSVLHWHYKERAETF